MKNGQRAKNIIEHCKKYPKLKLQDLFKYLYQSAFGCEHMISSLERATEYIKCESLENEEKNRKSSTNGYISSNLIQPLNGNYSRVDLDYLKQGLTAETFGALFYLSAKKEEKGLFCLQEDLELCKRLIEENLLRFNLEEYINKVEEWKKLGYPAIHHSPIFREEYRPSYRVISNEFIPFLPLFAKIDGELKNGNVRMAIEGGSASGKSTLCALIEKVYPNICVFHTDDFFLRPTQRTTKRLNEIGGNLDRERFLEEVLIPLEKGERVNYRVYDCYTQTILEPEVKTPQKLTITEGAYSLHPDFEKYYNLKIFLDVDKETQRARILKRNSPTFAKRFFEEWIPLEEKYFTAFNIKTKCDLVIKITED